MNRIKLGLETFKKCGNSLEERLAVGPVGVARPRLDGEGSGQYQEENAHHPPLYTLDTERRTLRMLSC